MNSSNQRDEHGREAGKNLFWYENVAIKMQCDHGSIAAQRIERKTWKKRSEDRKCTCLRCRDTGVSGPHLTSDDWSVDDIGPNCGSSMTRTKANGFVGADEVAASAAAVIKSSSRWRMVAINSVAGIAAAAADCVSGGGIASLGSTTMSRRPYDGGQNAA